MNIAFDPSEWSSAGSGDAGQSACAHPDWHCLRARLRASLEARTALDKNGADRPSRASGSFSPPAALSLGRIQVAFRTVNQTTSIYRKGDGAIVADNAGTARPGDREI